MPITSVLLGVAFVVLGGCTSSEPAPESLQPVTESQTPGIRELLGKVKYQRDKTNRALAALERNRIAAMGRLREKGVASTDDLKDVPEWRIHAQELRIITTDITRLTTTKNKLDAAILRLESAVRRMESETLVQQADLSEDDLDEISHIFHETSEKLKNPGGDASVNDIELEALLENELER